MPRALIMFATLLLLVFAAPAQAASDDDGTFDRDTVLGEVESFFGETSEGIADIVEKVFEDYGEPNAFITGEEVSAALGIGARFGSGTLHMHSGEALKMYWQGPSIGFDAGGNVSKVFVMIYDLPSVEALFQRFPAVEGSFYFVAGASVTYQHSEGITLAPVRTGVGLRTGANVGYTHYTRTKSWIPF